MVNRKRQEWTTCDWRRFTHGSLEKAGDAAPSAVAGDRGGKWAAQVAVGVGGPELENGFTQPQRKITGFRTLFGSTKVPRKSSYNRVEGR